MHIIDGSAGEGGGQILRSSLALSILTDTPFRIENIRAKRPRPGLLAQHLTAVRAAAQISHAHVEGAALGSLELIFRPQGIWPGEYHFTVGTAGSGTLVLQTVLLPLMLSKEPSILRIEGGTHNPKAPPFEFLEHCFLPLINQMGPQVKIHLDRYGFYPKGGGQFRAQVTPNRTLTPLYLLERGPIQHKQVQALVLSLPKHIAEREIQALKHQFPWDPSCFSIVEGKQSLTVGNYIMIRLSSGLLTEIFTGIGERGILAEVVAETVAHEAQEYLEAEVPVGVHLADQLLLPLALAGKGAFRTLAPSLHTFTQLQIIKEFLGIDIKVTKISPFVTQFEL